jgi:hypothetical protein
MHKHRRMTSALAVAFGVASFASAAAAQKLAKFEIHPLLSDPNSGTALALRVDRRSSTVKLCRAGHSNPSFGAVVLTGTCIDNGLANFTTNVARSDFATEPNVGPGRASPSFWAINVDSGAVQYCEFGDAAGYTCIDMDSSAAR